MADPHPNLAYSTVATAPSPATSGTSLVVASGEGARFGSTFPYNAVIWPANAMPTSANAEIVRVTARTADTLTITRTQEGTSARTVVVGDQIAAAITAKSLTDIETVANAAAVDTAVVHLAGTETITGAKTFSGATTDTNLGTVVSSVPRGAIEWQGITDRTGYTQTFLSGKLSGQTFNFFELYPIGLWLGNGTTFTDVGIERAASSNTINLWASGVSTPRMTIADPPTIYNTSGAQRNIGQDALSARASAITIANTETVVTSASLPANLMQAGTTFRVRATGVATASTATAGSTFRVRIGSTTLTGNIAASLAGTSAIGTNIPFSIEALVTVRTTGASGTALGSIAYNANAATGALNATVAVGHVTTAVTVDTTATKLIELTYISGVATTSVTFHVAVIELVKA